MSLPRGLVREFGTSLDDDVIDPVTGAADGELLVQRHVVEVVEHRALQVAAVCERR
jgi:hypothetical protein